MPISISKPTIRSVNLVRDCGRGIYADDHDLDAWAKHYVDSSVTRVAIDIDIIRRFAPDTSAKILELGSAPYLFTLSAKECGYNIHGVDLDPERFSGLLKDNELNITSANFEIDNLNLPNDYFDIVVMNEVFEHMRIDLIKTMKEVFRVCKPGGFLLISTPNLKSLRGIYNYIFKDKAYGLSGEIYNQYEKLSKIGHMGHVREYTCTEVSEFLEKIGFEIEDVVWRGRGEMIVARLLVTAIPRLRPFFTLIARKSASP